MPFDDARQGASSGLTRNPGEMLVVDVSVRSDEYGKAVRRQGITRLANLNGGYVLALFVIVILFRPEGLVGRVEERKV